MAQQKSLTSAISYTTAKPVSKRPWGLVLRRFAPWITVLVVLIVWQAVTMLQVVQPFLIPAPVDVLNEAILVLQNGTLWVHIQATMGPVCAGLVVGISLAVALGYGIARFPLLEDILSPLIVALQSTPVVAYAPLLVIWFGSGPNSKIITSALIVFFPMLLNTIAGLRNVPPGLRDLMRSLRATPWQTFTRLEVPAAMPVLMSGLKISATLAVIGAVVGEFISANAGLGFLINLARSQYDTPLVFVAVLTLTVLARFLYSLAAWLEYRALHWQRHGRYLPK
jgi:NitT/TauT family transport system permease protein